MCNQVKSYTKHGRPNQSWRKETVALNKLQRIQNRAAHLICGAKRHEHVSTYLTRLHWLPVRQRVNFKLLVYIYQCLNGYGSSPR